MIKTEYKRNLLGILFLLITTILWGTAFVVLKQMIADVPTFFVLTIRFFISGVILILVFIRKIIHISRRTLLHGAILGLTVFFAYGAQTVGLEYTTPARSAFITVAYCIFTPFMAWMFYKRRPHLYNIISCVVCMVGLAFISLIGQGDDGGVHLLGDGLTLVGAVFFALQLVFIEEYEEKGDDAMTLLSVELFVAGLLFLLVTLCYELPTMGPAAYSLPKGAWWRLLYLTIGCTLFAQMGQILGQRYTPANQASIIMGFESVVGAVTSVIIGMEALTVYLIVGFVLVFASGLISELHIDPFTIYRHFHPVVTEAGNDGNGTAGIAETDDDGTPDTDGGEGGTASDN